MIFSMDVRRARKGDCLLLHTGSNDDPGLVMIDGGPAKVYKPHLRPRLEEIRTARGIEKQDQLNVDLLMVSHVDDDHIQGILDLTRDEIAAKQAQKPRLLKVQSFWHNSFDSIIANNTGPLTASVSGHFGPAALTGAELSDKEKLAVEKISPQKPGIVVSSLQVLASISQGFQLRQDAAGLGWENLQFGESLIMTPEEREPINVAPGLQLSVIGPMQHELEALRKKHVEWLKALEKEGKSPPEALAAYVDKSVPNLSSLVLLAEADDKTMLLTGDARGDKIIEGLKLVGLLKKDADSTFEIDLLKVPHHGSANNLDDDFFERIIARHYVFSGNGEHGNPERESLEMLLKARGDEDYTVHLTYPVEELDVEREKDWKKEQAKEKNKGGEVREDWSPKKHSLGSLLEANKALAKKISIVDPVQPHVVDLLDKLEF